MAEFCPFRAGIGWGCTSNVDKSAHMRNAYTLKLLLALHVVEHWNYLFFLASIAYTNAISVASDKVKMNGVTYCGQVLQ